MARRASSARERSARGLLVQLLVVALWLGACALFTLSVAPAAFAALPSRELAGALVGRVLPVLFWAGAAAGALVATLELLVERGTYRRTRLASATAIAMSCLVAQLVVAPRIADLRARMREPLASLAPDDPQRVAFGRLHMASVAWLGAGMAAGAVFLSAAVLTLDRKDQP
jgi:hypothetical protein